MPSRGYGSYEPLRPAPPWWRRRPRPGWHSAWLRTAILGPLGWAALIGACLVAGALGALFAIWRGWPVPWAALAAAAAVVAGLVLADRRKWAGMTTRTGFPAPAGSGGAEVFADRIRRGLEEARVAADVTVVTPPGPGPEMIAGGHPDRPGAGAHVQVSYRRADRLEVGRVLHGLGVRLPDPGNSRLRHRRTGG